MSHSRKRHAAVRLRERYNSESPDSLLGKLEQEIASGNFIAISSDDYATKGTVSFEGEVFEVVFDNKRSKIVTALPKGSINAEKTKKYQGRMHPHDIHREYVPRRRRI